MALMQAPDNTPVWVNEDSCKACDICVSVCPAGTLAMQYDTSSTLEAMVKVVHPESCIGCNDCELSCPDFAIFIADKKNDGYKFAKLSDESKARAVAIKANNYMMIKE